jgi:hypothetical protein
MVFVLLDTEMLDALCTFMMQQTNEKNTLWQLLLPATLMNQLDRTWSVTIFNFFTVKRPNNQYLQNIQLSPQTKN